MRKIFYLLAIFILIGFFIPDVSAEEPTGFWDTFANWMASFWDYFIDVLKSGLWWLLSLIFDLMEPFFNWIRRAIPKLDFGGSSHTLSYFQDLLSAINFFVPLTSCMLVAYYYAIFRSILFVIRLVLKFIPGIG